jgi:hypothetical protein
MTARWLCRPTMIWRSDTHEAGIELKTSVVLRLLPYRGSILIPVKPQNRGPTKWWQASRRPSKSVDLGYYRCRKVGFVARWMRAFLHPRPQYLSTESAEVQASNPFHPLHVSTLQIPRSLQIARRSLPSWPLLQVQMIEYRESKPYWTKQLKDIALLFELRSFNGTNPPVPEVTVPRPKGHYGPPRGSLRDAYQEGAGVKHWDQRRKIPSREIPREASSASQYSTRAFVVS